MSIEPKKIRSSQRTALMGSVILLLLLTAIQLGLYLYGYDFGADLYLPSALPTITALVWIACAVGACLLTCSLPGKTVCHEMKISSSLLTDYASLLTMASLVSTVVLPLLMKNSSDPLGSLLASANVSDQTARTMLLLSLVLAVIAALHFLLQFVYRKITPQGVTAVLLWTGVSALRIYFDMRYLLMSPRRVLHLVALAAVLLFFIAELRLVRGLAAPFFYTLTASIAMVFAGADAITNFILTVTGRLTLGSEICTYFVLFASALYCLSRLHALAAPPKAVTAKVDSECKAEEEASDAEEALSDESPDSNSPDSPETEESATKSPDAREESPQ